MPEIGAPGSGAGPAASATHLVIIPSYNTGPRLARTILDARRWWNPVWVVIDGSGEADAAPALELARRDPGIRVFRLPRNLGKGAAILHGLEAAATAGFSHALTLDADGQHPAARIPDFMALSRRHPAAAIFGRPVFDSDAPLLRVRGRLVSNFWADLETLGLGIGDSLFGFRVYPIVPLCRIMRRTRWMRRFDFDAEAAVRLCWAGVEPISVPAAVRYLSPAEGGVSQFRYGRDNLLLAWMHLRLCALFLLGSPRLVPDLLRRAARQRAAVQAAARDNAAVDAMKRGVPQSRP